MSQAVSRIRYKLEVESQAVSKIRHKLELGSQAVLINRHKLVLGSQAVSRIRHELEFGTQQQACLGFGRGSSHKLYQGKAQFGNWELTASLP